MKENVWYVKTLTVDIVPGSTIRDIVQKLQTIYDHNLDEEYRVVSRVQISFSDKTKVEIDNRYDERELANDKD